MKQRKILFLSALFCAISAWATEYTVTYSTSTGSYTATNGAGTWASKWVSTATDPQVTLSVGANNIAVSTGYIYSGASGCTYTLTAQAGYLITGYTITGTAQSGAQTLTPAAGGSATSFAYKAREALPHRRCFPFSSLPIAALTLILRSQRRRCFAGETTPFFPHSSDNNNNSKESGSQRRKCFAGETTPFLLSSLDNNNSSLLIDFVEPAFVRNYTS